jgi:hypothetical protein
MRLGTASWQNPYARHLCCQLRACRYRPRNCRPPISMKNSRRALPLANSHKASLTAQTSTQAERLMRSGAHRSTPGSCRLGVVCDDRARFASLFTSASPPKATDALHGRRRTQSAKRRHSAPTRSSSILRRARQRPHVAPLGGFATKSTDPGVWRHGIDRSFGVSRFDAASYNERACDSMKRKLPIGGASIAAPRENEAKLRSILIELGVGDAFDDSAVHELWLEIGRIYGAWLAEQEATEVSPVAKALRSTARNLLDAAAVLSGLETGCRTHVEIEATRQAATILALDPIRHGGAADPQGSARCLRHAHRPRAGGDPPGDCRVAAGIRCRARRSNSGRGSCRTGQ